MISPPLMFVSVCRFLSLYNCRLFNSTWRLLKACLFKVLSVFGSRWCSLRPPFDKNQSSTGRRCCQWLLMVQCATARKTPVGEKSALLGDHADPAEEGPRGNSTDAGWGSIIRCLQFVFPTHTTPTERKRDGLSWDEQDGRAASHKVASRSQRV